MVTSDVLLSYCLIALRSCCQRVILDSIMIFHAVILIRTTLVSRDAISANWPSRKDIYVTRTSHLHIQYNIEKQRLKDAMRTAGISK